MRSRADSPRPSNDGDGLGSPTLACRRWRSGACIHTYSDRRAEWPTARLRGNGRGRCEMTMESLQATAVRLARQDPAFGLPGEYLDLTSRVLGAATRMSPTSIRAWLDEIAASTNVDPDDVARVWLKSLGFPALTPAQQRRAVAARLVTETSLWDRVRRSWPLEVHPC